MVMSRRIIRCGGHKENGILRIKLKFCVDSYWVGPVNSSFDVSTHNMAAMATISKMIYWSKSLVQISSNGY